MMILNFSSAFDTVDHNTLLSVLSSRFLISVHAFAWFRSYLTDRSQVFTTDSTHSPPIPLNAGVPQGSGLGPTQFIAYTDKKDGYRQQNVRQRQNLISIIDYDVFILEYLQQFWRYSPSKNGLTLKSGYGVLQGH